jgi:hypothetical protein
MAENESITEKPIRKKKPRKDKPKQYISPDGRAMPAKTEHRLNEAFAICFRGASGDLVLNYLRSISTNRVLDRGTPANDIVYQEGARWLMGIIDTRKRHGEEKKP